LQHIDFPLPRKHKPTLFVVIGRAPLTKAAAPMRKMRRVDTGVPVLADYFGSNFQEPNNDRLTK
jgi:hypothetical protein